VNEKNVEWHYIASDKPQQIASIASFAGSLRDEWRNEEWFDSLDDARRKFSLWRYDYYQVRPHSSQGNKAPDETRRTLEEIEGSSYHTLVQTDENEY
jgi:putative transposase